MQETRGSLKPIAMAAPSFDDNGVLEQVSDILRSGRLREGRWCKQFEEEFAAKVGARHAVAVNSGTAALHSIYLALLEPGDEVLIPSFTFIATGSMLLAMGAIPVFCDVDPRTFTIDPEDARKRITDRTRAIVPVHLFGNACPMDEINKLAEEHGLKVIGDAAQSHGTRYKGLDVGAMPEAVAFSFYPSKNMTTGEGGMIATSDDKLDKRFRLLRSHGQSEPYLHTMLGFNYRMTEVSAVLGLSQLGHLDRFLERRKANAAVLTEGLSSIGEIVTPVATQGAEHTYSQYSILLSDGLAERREEFRQHLDRAGVSSAVYYPKPMHQQPVFGGSLAGGLSLPVTEDLAGRILSLPAHPALSDEDLGRIVEAVKGATKAIQ